MKKLFPLVLFVSFHSWSQELSRPGKENEKTGKDYPGITSDITVRTSEGNNAGYANNIPSAVWNSFLEQFEDAASVSWYVDSRDVTASFRLDNEDLIVTYRKDGILVCIRRVYEGKQLNRQIKNLLQSEIKKGFRISYVTEVQHELQTSYEVSLQNQKDWLMIQVTQDAVAGRPEVLSRKSFRKG